jgi:site-specific recombinase XerD
MRRSEIVSLKWENVNFAKKFILLEDSKSGKSRKVPMNKVVAEAIKRINQTNEYVFFNHKTKARVKNVIKSFMIACKRAGIKGVNIYALRHTTATEMINEAGVDVVTAGRILDYSSIKMILRYCHPSEETMQRAVDKLEEIFEKSRHSERFGQSGKASKFFIII